MHTARAGRAAWIPTSGATRCSRRRCCLPNTPPCERLRVEPNDTLLSDLVNTVIPEWGRTLTDEELHAEMMADTFVGGYDERVAVEAIRRELLREGQVFWVHNRVQTIEAAAARLRELVPEARIAIAHGKMDEGSLEQVVVDFWEGRFDVLVCTTIIESGIDMPTVNTLVVERASPAAAYTVAVPV